MSHPRKKLAQLNSDGIWVCREHDVPLNFYGKNDKNIVLEKNVGDADNNALLELYDKIKANTPSLLVKLGQIKQLALANYWWMPFPSIVCDATKHTKHTRLDHSVGVLRIANAWFKRNSSSNRPEFDNWKSILERSALLHDIGHSPFSHLLERVFQELNWSFEGNGVSFSHESLSKFRIFSLYKKEPNNAKMSDAAQKELIKIFELLDGNSGIAWIDAIINSPIDADKIDYIFRDQQSLKISGHLEEPQAWLENFLSQQKIATTGQIMLTGVSAQACFKILAERCYMYDNFYHSTRVQLLERIVQYVLSTFFTLYVSRLAIGAVLENIEYSENKSKDEVIFCEDFVNQVTLTLKEKYGIFNIKSLCSTDNERFIAAFESNIDTAICYKKFCSPDIDKTSSEGCLFHDFSLIKLLLALTVIDYFATAMPRYNNLLSSNHEFDTESDSVCDKYKKYLIDNGDNIKNIGQEFAILTEIGLWACEQFSNDREPKNKKNYENLVGICRYLLDPVSSIPSNNEEKPEEIKERTTTYDENQFNYGRWMDILYEQHNLAGPYVIRIPTHIKELHKAEDWLDEQKRILTEIGRQLAMEYPQRVIVSVTGPLRVRSYPQKRILKTAHKASSICEQFWVPSGDPETWGAKSQATVPLAEVDFRKSIPQAYKLQVALIDLSDAQSGRSVILDRFKIVCSYKGIKLE